MSPATGDFCQNVAKKDSIKEHMGKYRDIFCTISEFKNPDVKSNVKDIEKVNIPYYLSTNYNTALQSGLYERSCDWLKFNRSLKSCQTGFLADFVCIHKDKLF